VTKSLPHTMQWCCSIALLGSMARLRGLAAVGWNGATHGASSGEKTSVSSKQIGTIVGNRRSHIYAWPGCGSYDTMAPQNRVVFPSSQAAEQAGYRVAYNCPMNMSPTSAGLVNRAR
jgi:hypothetical protein